MLLWWALLAESSDPSAKRTGNIISETEKLMLKFPRNNPEITRLRLGDFYILTYTLQGYIIEVKKHKRGEESELRMLS